MQYAYATVIFEEPDLLHFMMLSDDIVVFFHSKFKKKEKKQSITLLRISL